MIAKRLWPGLILALLGTSAACADPRIVRLPYDSERVTVLDFCLGFQTTIVFGDGETLENVALGDAARFQAVGNRRGDAVFIKSVVEGARTNMTVITSAHRYNFELRASPKARCPAAHTMFSLSFSYPEPALKPVVDAAKSAEDVPVVNAKPERPPRNAAYSFTGVAANAPLRVSDDGRATYFRWPEGEATPAIYAVDSGGAVTLVNYAIEGEDLVVDLVAPAFELRRGEAVTRLFNDGFKVQQRDAASPQPRPQPKNPRRLAIFGAKE